MIFIVCPKRYFYSVKYSRMFEINNIFTINNAFSCLFICDICDLCIDIFVSIILEIFFDIIIGIPILVFIFILNLFILLYLPFLYLLQFIFSISENNNIFTIKSNVIDNTEKDIENGICISNNNAFNQTVKINQSGVFIPK